MSNDQAHEIDAEWDTDAGAWHHRCVRCGAESTGNASTLPCEAPGGEVAPVDRSAVVRRRALHASPSGSVPA